MVINLPDRFTKLAWSVETNLSDPYPFNYVYDVC